MGGYGYPVTPADCHERGVPCDEAECEVCYPPEGRRSR